MSDSSMERLLVFARNLQNAATLAELLQTAYDEVTTVTGYRNVWFYLTEQDNPNVLRLIESSSSQKELLLNVARELNADGDALIQELLRAEGPVVIPDARTDPRTDKEIVERLGNRTLINIPLRLVDKPLGIFGLGTYSDEGVRAPTPEQLHFLIGMASQLVVAISRIQFQDMRIKSEKERTELERRLTQSQRLESLGLLAGGIAHDFNNLLTVITVSSALALERATDATQRTEIKSVMDAARRGEDLTRQLLAMSRAQELELKLIDVNLHLRQLLRIVRRILPENIEIDMIEAAGLSLIEGDGTQIDQVFMNLLINARDAMPYGGRLTIETQQVLVNGHFAVTHPWAKSGRYVLVTITDNGVGMSREVQERVFEPFFTTKGPRVGTGLGLAVVYGIVRQHRGMVHCYSEEGIGTTFKVYLPAAEQLASDVGTKIERQPVGGRESILVAEDDEFVRTVVHRILERAGYQVKVVEDGESACRAAAETPFDVVLLDVVMPGMSCFDTVTRIKLLLPHTPIILSSGYAAGANTSTLIKLTGNEILTKPYDPDRMLLAVRNALDTPSGRTDS
jgi:signal transduction histidine kinase/CheY-like chemotaxis protein